MPLDEIKVGQSPSAGQFRVWKKLYSNMNTAANRMDDKALAWVTKAEMFNNVSADDLQRVPGLVLTLGRRLFSALQRIAEGYLDHSEVFLFNAVQRHLQRTWQQAKREKVSAAILGSGHVAALAPPHGQGKPKAKAKAKSRVRPESRPRSTTPDGGELPKQDDPCNFHVAEGETYIAGKNSEYSHSMKPNGGKPGREQSLARRNSSDGQSNSAKPKDKKKQKCSSFKGGKGTRKLRDACPYKQSRGGPALAATVTLGEQAPSSEGESERASRRALNSAALQGARVAVARKATGGPSVSAGQPAADASSHVAPAAVRPHARLQGR
jgi:hypothetical protein